MIYSYIGIYKRFMRKAYTGDARHFVLISGVRSAWLKDCDSTECQGGAAGWEVGRWSSEETPDGAASAQSVPRSSCPHVWQRRGKALGLEPSADSVQISRCLSFKVSSGSRSQLVVIFASRGHLAMSDDIFGCHNSGNATGI